MGIFLIKNFEIAYKPLSVNCSAVFFAKKMLITFLQVFRKAEKLLLRGKIFLLHSTDIVTIQHSKQGI